MSIRTFWSIFLKILGLYLISNCLQTITATYAYATAALASEHLRNMAITAAIVTLAIYLVAMWALLFKTEWIIDTLRLDKGFKEETIDLNMGNYVVLKIATIVLGGLIVVESLPWFCIGLLSMLDENSLKDTTRFLTDSIKTIIGLVLLLQSKPIVESILKKANE